MPLFPVVSPKCAQSCPCLRRGEQRCETSGNLPGLMLASAYSEMLTCGVGRYGNSVRNILAGFPKGITYMNRNNIFQVTPVISPQSPGQKLSAREYVLR